MKEKCIIENCENFRMVRGLCTNCYGTAGKLVARKETSWEKLEEVHLSIPLRKLKTSKFQEAYSKILK